MKQILIVVISFFCITNKNIAQSCPVITEPPALNAGTATNSVVCQNTNNTIQLETLLNGEDNAGAWSLNPLSAATPGIAFDNTTGKLITNALSSGIYSFIYTVGTGTCTDEEIVNVTVQNCCSPKTCTSVKISKL